MSVTGKIQADKVTVRTLREYKEKHVPIRMLTAYDYSFARLIDQAGMEITLIGDSLAMVALGYETTLPVTMEEMLHHCRAVSRGTRRAMLVGDMPFLSYQVSVDEAVRNAGLFLKEGQVDAVKLEGGRERQATIKAIVDTGIPVMGHIGLTPQSVHHFGGFFVQGKTAREGIRLLEDALALAQAGCFSLVLESIPGVLAEYITGKVNIPTIGIGAGSGCDGQVLVTQDLLGLFEQFQPKFVKVFGDAKPLIETALHAYAEDVKSGSFPEEKHTFHMPDAEWEDFIDQAERLIL